MTWAWPLPQIPLVTVPVGEHPGAFGFKRKHDYHTGIDLYAPPGSQVVAVEPGIVRAVEPFTGTVESPWWLPTDCVMVEGESGVVCYGEITPGQTICTGRALTKGEHIGTVAQVLKVNKGLPMSMLHLELYQHGTQHPVWWRDVRPAELRDPTPYLITSTSDRPEMGRMQFGSDWPGVFLRGDHAQHYAVILRAVKEHLKGFDRGALEALIGMLDFDAVPLSVEPAQRLRVFADCRADGLGASSE